MHRFIVVVRASAAINAPAVSQVMTPSQTQNGIEFVTGGVGRDSTDAFRAVTPDFNLRPTFSRPGGAFLANVKVELREAQGRTLATTITQGPFSFAGVPAETP